jgi:hypothetical protein
MLSIERGRCKMRLYSNILELIGGVVTLLGLAIVLWLYFIVYGPGSGGSPVMLYAAAIVILGLAILVIGSRRTEKT